MSEPSSILIVAAIAGLFATVVVGLGKVTADRCEARGGVIVQGECFDRRVLLDKALGQNGEGE